MFLRATVVLNVAALSLAAMALVATPKLSFSQTNSAFPALKKLSAEQTHVSALAVKLDNPRIIWRMNAAHRLTPASLSKLYVAAAALKRWGPNKSFSTPLLAKGRMHNGVLRGD